MLDLNLETASAYLASRGHDVNGLRASSLGGGVSNEVLLCEWPDHPGRSRFVIKQALGRLRVAEEWLADRSRIEREWKAIALASRLMPARSAPELLWTDPVNGIYAMSAAPASARSWKELLLDTNAPVPRGVAARVAEMLGEWIARSWRDPALEQEYGDKTAFDQLRLDPYYRFTAGRHPEAAAFLHELTAHSLDATNSLVHGDWSPKNILVGDDVWAIDFEVVHFGDPGFDVAFLLNHLLLKWTHRRLRVPAILEEAQAFWNSLTRRLDNASPEIERTALRHLPALMLARVDGKSPAEYLTPDERTFFRDRAMHWIRQQPASLRGAIDEASRWRFN